jgi:hypothetical protein
VNPGEILRQDDLKLPDGRRVGRLRQSATLFSRDFSNNACSSPVADRCFDIPCPPTRGEAFSFTKLRSRKDVNDRFKIVATKLGFAALRLHDLRGTHETLLLDAVVPVQVVAARRGHDLPPSSCGAMPSERVRPTGPPLVLLGALSRGALGK